MIICGGWALTEEGWKLASEVEEVATVVEPEALEFDSED